MIYTFATEREKWEQILLALGTGDKNTLAWRMQWTLLKLC